MMGRIPCDSCKNSVRGQNKQKLGVQLENSEISVLEPTHWEHHLAIIPIITQPVV